MQLLRSVGNISIQWKCVQLKNNKLRHFPRENIPSKIAIIVIFQVLNKTVQTSGTLALKLAAGSTRSV